MIDPSLSHVEKRPPKARKVYVVLPAYNEALRIGKLLDRIDDAMLEAGAPYRVILVDDGSRDATERIVEERGARMPIPFLRHPVNLGLGATIRDGLIAATEAAAGRDIIV